MTIKPVLVPDHDAVSLRALMDSFATAAQSATPAAQANRIRQQLTESAEPGVTEGSIPGIGSNLPQSDIETFGLQKGRSYKINPPKDFKPGDRKRAVQQLIPTQDKKDHIRSRLGKHVAPALPEQDMSEGVKHQYQMTHADGTKMKFTAADDADAKRQARAHGATSLRKSKGEVEEGWKSKLAAAGLAGAAALGGYAAGSSNTGSGFSNTKGIDQFNKPAVSQTAQVQPLRTRADLDAYNKTRPAGTSKLVNLPKDFEEDITESVDPIAQLRADILRFAR